MKTPREILELMLEKDAFSKWMGLEVVEIELGKCVLQCVVHENMLNGFEITHGGISYSLADSALAFASNSYGYQCVSIETSISHIRPVHLGDVLLIACSEIHRGKSFGIYTVSITSKDQLLVAKFKGTVSISSNQW